MKRVMDAERTDRDDETFADADTTGSSEMRHSESDSNKSCTSWMRRQGSRRWRTTTAVILALAAIAVTVAVSLLPEPWRDVQSNAKTSANDPLPTTSEHPDFTGPHKYEFLNAWNNLHTEVGRDVLEDGVVTDDERSEVFLAYNQCLSVYGLQSRPFVDENGKTNGQTVVSIRGSMSSEQQSDVIDQCAIGSDYRWIEPLAAYGSDHPAALGDMQR
ncbi:hypothetical protein [Bifidobacterium miconisargentati]|uniref:hypothetical protein n=1 Tax=Bifidobacterium miconisargentati TaxID=2834437 RepID=UPI001BDDC4F1|nr:hypothetical protein [Bifidobacterium miconisargentati]MBW3089133.1 hypothetical protein [Bifidobacterium miconisargentati]